METKRNCKCGYNMYDNCEQYECPRYLSREIAASQEIMESAIEVATKRIQKAILNKEMYANEH